jgi:hypothetical protein
MIIGICIFDDLARYQLMNKSLQIRSNKNLQGLLGRRFGPLNQANLETHRSQDLYESGYNIF